MKAILDAHTHTVASGHGTSDTATALIRAARDAGLGLLAITDHGSALPNSAKESYFLSLRTLPRERMGIRVLYGVETDILDETGALGISERARAGLDLTIGSFHPPCFRPSDRERNTAALVAALRSGKIDVAGHPDDEKYPLAEAEVAEAAAECGAMIEVNEASLAPNGYRGDAAARYRALLAECAKRDVTVLMGSDSHGAARVGAFPRAEALLAEVGYPEELIANLDVGRFLRILSLRRGKR